ncbi:transposase [Cypionkella sp.]|uniref:transposase n=1 Tax=Cypionkella sp. TaxID=2811411 RepID=UPI0039FC95C7
MPGQPFAVPYDGRLTVAEWLIAGRDYDVDGFREVLKDKGIRPSHHWPEVSWKDRPLRQTALQARNWIEIMFARLKDWRRIATRCDVRAKVFLSAITLAAAVMFWL